MSNFYSSIKELALEIAYMIDELASQEIKHQTIRRFWNWFFTSHARSIIIKKPDDELKIILQKAYEKLKPVFEKKMVSNQLKESIKFNEPKQVELLMKMPDFEKLRGLEIDEFL